MSQQPTSTRHFTVNEKLTTLITTTNEEVKKLETEIKTKSQQVLNFVTGVCINEGVDLQKEGVYFSDDYKTIYVYDLPSKEEPVTENENDNVEEVDTEEVI